MSEAPNTGADNQVSFSDLVSEQPGNVNTPGAAPAVEAKVEQPKPAEVNTEAKPDGVKPDEGIKPAEGEAKPEGELFWGKFKSPDDAKSSYDQAQTKIIDQGTKINDLTKANEENTRLISAIDAAIAKNPELAEQLKEALTGAGEPQDDNQGDIDSLLDKKLEEREKQFAIKAEREKWVTEHPDFSDNNGELGHKILDLLESEGLAVTAKTMQLAYDHLTKDAKISEASKKAAEEALKKEELAELDRQNGAAVGGGNNDAKPAPAKDDIFGSFVGRTSNPNSL